MDKDVESFVADEFSLIEYIHLFFTLMPYSMCTKLFQEGSLEKVFGKVTAAQVSMHFHGEAYDHSRDLEIFKIGDHTLRF